jgi:hypothetical protein
MTEMITNHGVPEDCDWSKMADPKYADLPGIVSYFDKYCFLFAMYAMM